MDTTCDVDGCEEEEKERYSIPKQRLMEMVLGLLERLR